MASNCYVQAHLISQLNHIPTRGLGWRFFAIFSAITRLLISATICPTVYLLSVCVFVC